MNKLEKEIVFYENKERVTEQYLEKVMGKRTVGYYKSILKQLYQQDTIIKTVEVEIKGKLYKFQY